VLRLQGRCARRHLQLLSRWLAALAVLVPAWWWAYTHLTAFADTLLGWTGLSRQTLGESLHFFFYDTPKVLLLLTGVVFVMGVVQTWFAPSAPAPCWPAARGRRQCAGGLLGIVTPFCSCSAVPLFIGISRPACRWASPSPS
jgi:uncharacterized membrane protein YraQ (UPF0718 family)